MPEITTYDPGTGEVVAYRSGPSIELLIAQIPVGQPYIEAAVNGAAYRVNPDTKRPNKKPGAPTP